MQKKDTRSEIIRIGTELIARQGFNTTRIDAVLLEAGVPKGSFYHYFKSKEDFGLAVIDHFAERFEQRLDTFLNDEEVTPLNRIHNFLESTLTRITQNQCSKGCLIGNLGQELADLNERFRDRLDEIFNMWKERFVDCLRDAQKAGEISTDIDLDVMACFILSGWEGAILRAKVMKSPQPMKGFIDVLFTSLLR
ncbi:transcriptional regulator, TetR family [Trichlorobacter thiogenes]|uniref:Transcriptional regulator, TetR family n=1 Tax=Trichlorobacter thiogenes TaxID=115783 RepID=A0A1T4S5R5_9BACT|nr:TetR family transcriptional regulator C-terminal domain-containing protein [Trichlorobacter thiogenes]SKA23497.1 transcriptional regulator, TetR family [Trichlorobacter thiogenes]